MGIDLSQVEPNLTPTINAFRRANLDLITSMARDKVERVKAILDDAPNARVETIRDRIMEEGNVTRRQAALIARDQVLSLNAQVTEKRHAAAGVEKYTWRTSGDGDVRPAHRALNGKVFTYADPPVVDAKKGRRENPGQDYQCRCTAEPVIEWGDEEAAAKRTDAGDFKESEHPRDEDGEFTSGGGGGRSGARAAAEAPDLARIDPSALASAATAPRRTPPAPGAPSPALQLDPARQKGIRDAGRQIPVDAGLPPSPSHPAIGRSAHLFNAYEVHDASTMNGIDGMLAKDGRLLMTSDHHANLVTYMDRVKQGTTAAASAAESEAMLTYVHETLHEHSNVAASAFSSPAAAIIEEGMTELAARRVMREQYQASGANTAHLAGGPPPSPPRAYDHDLAALRKAIHGTLARRAAQIGLPPPSLAAVDHALDRAAFDYKRGIATAPTAKTAADVVRPLLSAMRRHLPAGFNDPPAIGALNSALLKWTP